MFGGESLRFRLILSNLQDPDKHFNAKTFLYRETNKKNRPTSLKLALVEATPLFLLVFIPFSVNAGLITSFLGLLESEAIVYEVPKDVSGATDVKLLSSLANPDPKASLGGGDLIYQDGALIPNGPFSADDVSATAKNAGEISVYVVREGDSLSQIAEMFGVTTNTILWANDLPRATAIKPGDELVILPIVGVRHIVKTGDTLNSIAKKYESDVAEIASYNQLTDNTDLSVGETLIIPGGNMHTAPAKAVATASKSTASTGSTGGSVASGYIHPVPGAVRTQGIHGYNAVDLAAPIGTPIRSAAAGEVIVSKSSGWNGGYGNYVVIKHSNGSQTLYAHTSSNTVAVGAKVGAGETIGYVGNSGRSTGAHLHFEVRGGKNPF